uniref:RRM domain-containing protein n=1 Tax=Rhodosorus marinus TaxID=101924 RepID=A0A7S2ZHB1_9RHOD|mmetsp:Transcript_18955/g.76071  ORF Transcript_18955/g.76071 Transcript_18955/m.76071 type:complete len:453 (+) Transcript_18955:154-1512(+)
MLSKGSRGSLWEGLLGRQRRPRFGLTRIGPVYLRRVAGMCTESSKADEGEQVEEQPEKRPRGNSIKGIPFKQCVEIKNLPSIMRRDMLRDHYAIFGNVLDAGVVPTPVKKFSQAHRGGPPKLRVTKGYVCFDSEESAIKAQKVTHNARMGDFVLNVKILRRTLYNPKRGEENYLRPLLKVFISDLAPEVTLKDLRQMFEESGLGVDDLSSGKKSETDTDLGIAFARFLNQTDGKKALELSGTELHGSAIKIRPKRLEPIEKQTPGSKVVILNLDYNKSREEITAHVKEKLSGVGELVNVQATRIEYDKSAYSLAEFEDEEKAKECIKQFNKSDVDGRTWEVFYARNEVPGEAIAESPILYITNLPESENVVRLRDSLRDFLTGIRQISDCRVFERCEPTGKFLSAKVQCVSTTDAVELKNLLRGRTFMERKLHATFTQQPILDGYRYAAIDL